MRYDTQPFETSRQTSSHSTQVQRKFNARSVCPPQRVLDRPCLSVRSISSTLGATKGVRSRASRGTLSLFLFSVSSFLLSSLLLRVFVSFGKSVDGFSADGFSVDGFSADGVSVIP
nr:MAG TPA: hypothetical protein [Caudoviricetes sp.]